MDEAVTMGDPSAPVRVWGSVAFGDAVSKRPEPSVILSFIFFSKALFEMLRDDTLDAGSGIFSLKEWFAFVLFSFTSTT